MFFLVDSVGGKDLDGYLYLEVWCVESVYVDICASTCVAATTSERNKVSEPKNGKGCLTFV
jgi:hypothetical protein